MRVLTEHQLHATPPSPSADRALRPSLNIPGQVRWSGLHGPDWDRAPRVRDETDSDSFDDTRAPKDVARHFPTMLDGRGRDGCRSDLPLNVAE